MWYTQTEANLTGIGPASNVFHVSILSAASYCSFTDIPHQCGQTRCWHRGVNRANQPENEMEKLSQKATQPIIWYFRSAAASVEADVGSLQPAWPVRRCTPRRLEPTSCFVPVSPQTCPLAQSNQFNVVSSAWILPLVSQFLNLLYYIRLWRNQHRKFCDWSEDKCESNNYKFVISVWATSRGKRRKNRRLWKKSYFSDLISSKSCQSPRVIFNVIDIKCL